jgi:Cu-Zn family superoxide dismutase
MLGRKLIRHRLTQLGLAAALCAAIAAPASAGDDAEVTSGSFVTLPGGAALGYDIGGHASMRRVPGGGGSTTITVHVTGLDADTRYPAHVHNAPCDATPPGGGHYQHTVGGPVDAANEIWPIVSSNPAGVGRGFARHANWARPDAMAVVIHYPANTSIRLACVDLR